MNNWKTIIEKNKISLENLLLLASYGYFAGNNYGFCINADKFRAESPTKLLNKILEISRARLSCYKNTKQYSKVSVSISASGNGVYIEYSTGEMKV